MPDLFSIIFGQIEKALNGAALRFADAFYEKLDRICDWCDRHPDAPFMGLLIFAAIYGALCGRIYL